MHFFRATEISDRHAETLFSLFDNDAFFWQKGPGFQRLTRERDDDCPRSAKAVCIMTDALAHDEWYAFPASIGLPPIGDGSEVKSSLFKR